MHACVPQLMYACVRIVQDVFQGGHMLIAGVYSMAIAA